MSENPLVDEFLRHALIPRDGLHSEGTLDAAAEMLAAHPELAASSIYTAAVLGEVAVIRRFIAEDAALVSAPGGPYGWDALTHLCFSRFLQHDAARSASFVESARILLGAGANAKAGWYEKEEYGDVWESLLYGAAGIAHNEALTMLLLEHGADPTENEVVYHTPESYENGALRALIDTGRLSADDLASMLLRKADWHDVAGARLLLERGASPNHATRWGRTALHQAILRNNPLAMVQTMLEYGGDPSLRFEGQTAAEIALARGRTDIVNLLNNSIFEHGSDRGPAEQ